MAIIVETIAAQVWKEPTRNLLEGTPAAPEGIYEQFAAAIWAYADRALSEVAAAEGTSLISAIPAPLPDRVLAGLPGKIPAALPNDQSAKGLRLDVTTGGELIGFAWISNFDRPTLTFQATRFGSNYAEWDPVEGGLTVETPVWGTWKGVLPDGTYNCNITNPASTKWFFGTVKIIGGVFSPNRVTMTLGGV
jgi:hypothetical protein